MPTVVHGGDKHEVTARWHARNSSAWPHFAVMELVDLAERKRQIDDRDNLGQLTRDLHLERWHLTHHLNVRRALAVLGTGAHTQHGLPGVDHLHGNNLTFPCGCAIRVVLDHHADFAARAAADIVTPHANPGIQAWRQYLWDYAAEVAGLDPSKPEQAMSAEVYQGFHDVLRTCLAHGGITDPRALHAAAGG